VSSSGENSEPSGVPSSSVSQSIGSVPTMRSPLSEMPSPSVSSVHMPGPAAHSQTCFVVEQSGFCGSLQSALVTHSTHDCGSLEMSHSGVGGMQSASTSQTLTVTSVGC
jgi:hypothetical protein